jgi:hypothetical protein
LLISGIYNVADKWEESKCIYMKFKFKKRGRINQTKGGRTTRYLRWILGLKE